MSELTQDRRLQRGAQSRRTIVRHAVDVASRDGLDGLSLGKLATDLGISKSGVQTLFGSKEKLQLAAVDAARAAFEDAVLAPATAHAAGVDRLRAMIELWIAYVEQPLFPGGCFWAANMPVFDSRPGPVRDTLAGQQRAWRELIARELRTAIASGQLHDIDADLTAFQIDAVLVATNIALRLADDPGAPSDTEVDPVARARRAVDALLGHPTLVDQP